jgi:hypothetical protein
VDEGRIELDSKRAYEYGLQVEKVLELLLFLVHLSGGFPPRANELLEQCPTKARDKLLKRAEEIARKTEERRADPVEGVSGMRTVTCGVARSRACDDGMLPGTV